MGFVVGKLGKAPDGSRVAIELTGPLARTIRVAVDGRAQVVDDFGGQEPTATIRLDGAAVHQAGRRAPMRRRARRTSNSAATKTSAARIVEHLNYRDLTAGLARKIIRCRLC